MNKFAYSKGGAEVYMASLAGVQANDGNDVAVFGGDLDPSFLDEKIEKYGIEIPDFHSADTLQKKARAAQAVFWNRDAAKELDRVIGEFCPDVVHLHNYAHQLSSSVLPVIRKRGIPSVYTAHDYKLICPSYVANISGEDCFSCVKKLSLKPIIRACHQTSRTWSSVVLGEAIGVRTLGLTPDLVIAPSDFMGDRLAESWLSPHSSIITIPNPASWDGGEWKGSGDFVLFVGRLSREKGVDELVHACHGAGIPLVVAGDGPLRSELQSAVTGLGANVRFTGHLPHEELLALRQNCIAQVIPSTWPENAPLSVLEAGASGVPMIASNRGGLPEFMSDGARIALVDEITAAALEAALERIERLPGDAAMFRTRRSWHLHERRVMDAYVRVTGAEK
ncbi:glycosyltransferase [Microbacterium testaceum]|nr:glycosyltransferase [Microbacterium testaceum]